MATYPPMKQRIIDIFKNWDGETYSDLRELSMMSSQMTAEALKYVIKNTKFSHIILRGAIQNLNIPIKDVLETIDAHTHPHTTRSSLRWQCYRYMCDRSDCTLKLKLELKLSRTNIKETQTSSHIPAPSQSSVPQFKDWIGK